MHVTAARATSFQISSPVTTSPPPLRPPHLPLLPLTGRGVAMNARGGPAAVVMDSAFPTRSQARQMTYLEQQTTEGAVHPKERPYHYHHHHHHQGPGYMFPVRHVYQQDSTIEEVKFGPKHLERGIERERHTHTHCLNFSSIPMNVPLHRHTFSTTFICATSFRTHSHAAISRTSSSVKVDSIVFGYKARRTHRAVVPMRRLHAKTTKLQYGLSSAGCLLACTVENRRRQLHRDRTRTRKLGNAGPRLAVTLQEIYMYDVV